MYSRHLCVERHYFRLINYTVIHLVINDNSKDPKIESFDLASSFLHSLIFFVHRISGDETETVILRSDIMDA